MPSRRNAPEGLSARAPRQGKCEILRVVIDLPDERRVPRRVFETVVTARLADVEPKALNGEPVPEPAIPVSAGPVRRGRGTSLTGKVALVTSWSPRRNTTVDSIAGKAGE